MAARVGIAVEDDKTELPAKDHKVPGVLRTRGSFTEDTLRLVFLFLHVGGTPGGPQVVHRGRLKN